MNLTRARALLHMAEALDELRDELAHLLEAEETELQRLGPRARQSPRGQLLVEAVGCMRYQHDRLEEAMDELGSLAQKAQEQLRQKRETKT